MFPCPPISTTKRPPGLRDVSDTTEQGWLIVNPMEGGVGKYGVETAVEGKLSGVDDLRCDAALAGGVDHFRGCIDTQDMSAAFGDLRGQDAVAAAEVENLFAGFGIEPFQNVRAQVGDKSAVGGILAGIPGL